MASIALGEAWPMQQLVKLQRTQPALVGRVLRRLLDEDDIILATKLNEVDAKRENQGSSEEVQPDEYTSDADAV